MDELIKAWTRAGNAIAAYYEKAGSPLTRVTDAPPAPRLSEDVPPKTRKPRAPKDETIAAAPAPTAAPAPAAAAAPTSAAVLEPTEEDSLKEVRALAKTFVQRFQNQVDGIKAFRELIAATTGVARIDDLVHSQRLVVIAKAKAEIAKGKVAAPAPAETAGTAV